MPDAVPAGLYTPEFRGRGGLGTNQMLVTACIRNFEVKVGETTVTKAHFDEETVIACDFNGESPLSEDAYVKFRVTVTNAYDTAVHEGDITA